METEKPFDLNFTKNYTLSYYECYSNRLISEATIMHILQDSAEGHIAVLGISVETCLEKGVFWVTTGYNIKIIRPPRVGEKIKVVTWISSVGAATAIREFAVLDSEGKIIIKASSQWAMLKLSTRRPTAIARSFEQKFPVQAEKYLDVKFSRFSSLQRADFAKMFPIEYGHVDANGHLNNAYYPSWASYTVDSDFRKNHYPTSLKIAFVEEAFYTEEIEILTQLDGLNSSHLIKSQKDGRVLANVCIGWQKTSDIL